MDDTFELLILPQHLSSRRDGVVQDERPKEEGIDDEGQRILSSFPELNNGHRGMYDITALQVLCAFAKSGTVTASLRSCVETRKREINFPDQLGRTPLLYATLNANLDLLLLLLDNGADPECKFTCKSDTNYKDTTGDYEKWNKLFVKLHPVNFSNDNLWGRTPLHLAAKEGHADIVKMLVARGANVNAADDKGVTPLLLAGCCELDVYEQIAEILVTHGADTRKKDSTGITPLLKAVSLGSIKIAKLLLESGVWLSSGSINENELHIASLHGYEEILKLFLQHPKITTQEINKADTFGRTPAHRAAFTGRENCLKLLLEKGANLAHKNKGNETVSSELFKEIDGSMEFFNDILDDRITKNNNLGKIVLDFNILAPDDSRGQMDVLASIFDAFGENGMLHIVRHPLIESYLNLKWAKVREFFYFLIFSYVCFVIALSGYVLLLVDNKESSKILKSITTVIMCISSVGLLTHAIIQSIVMWKHLWRKYEIWMNLCCTFLVLMLVLFGDTDKNMENTQEWVLHATSISVLLAWTELMLLLGRFPTLGYYALMFGIVLQNVIKVLLTFSGLVIGFALSFSIQFYKEEHFNNPWSALVKTTVMMTGEFEYEGLFSEEDAEGKNRRLPVTSRFTFLFFIIVASIVLMNLMIGLAVNDIQELQAEGNARRLQKQAEFLEQFERVTYKIMHYKFVPKWLYQFLSRRRKVGLKFSIDVGCFRAKKASRYKRLSPRLLESLTNIANRKKKSSIQSELPRILEIINMLVENYDTKCNNACNNNFQ